MTGRPTNPDDEYLDNFMKGFADASDAPDIGFTLVHHDQPPAIDQQQIAAQAKELTHTIARELAATAPAGWERLDVVFVWTVAAQSWRIFFSKGDRSVRVDPSEKVLTLVREQREVAARMVEGPWWRMLIRLTSAGALETEYDYGDEPFPDDDLFVPDAYLADLQTYPRLRVPVWLAAYIGHQDRQKRSPRVAAEQARGDSENGVLPHPSTEDFPPLPRLWGRWATIAAMYAATDSPEGPRILPSLAWFESPTRSGSTLYLLAHDRAVISGGVWNAPELETAYNQGTPMPELYAGAPEWITDAVLNPRAATGTLSFCYWWDNGHWYRGQSPTGPGIAVAVPGLWTAESTAGIVARVLTSGGRYVDEKVKDAAAELISAAESGTVTRSLVTAVLDADTFDVDAALNQFTLAGLTLSIPESPLPKGEALARVRHYILEHGYNTTAYPLERLTAERIDHGWMVFVPTAPGQIMIGRAIYYIADDGVIEKSSSSIPPHRYLPGFGQRFRERITRTN
ncbi:hypothetical protein ACFXPS_22195 [Nocardia sp. NPDC059091]|uniref:hypothetical protein n=1 Tax=Nocardia sp. NPDC059091 TaxID=3346724 RepID=UPI00367678BB